MNIEIRKLTPELIPDYIDFFDNTPHATGKEEHKCYCIWWCNDDLEGKDFSTVEKRRKIAIQYINGNNIRGYLAYCNNKVVGWCNANTKAECLKCYCWRRFMGAVQIEEDKNERVKSVFCFAVAPEMRGKGIAGLLLERVCEDARKDRFDYVEAYPNKQFVNMEEDFMGPLSMYTKIGFELSYETEDKYIMRKALK